MATGINLKRKKIRGNAIPQTYVKLSQSRPFACSYHPKRKLLRGYIIPNSRMKVSISDDK